MRAVFYGRVSTDEQAKEGYSLQSQEDKNTQFIQSQDWVLVDKYVDDGYSAKNLKRPDMQRLIENAKAKKFDVVVFYKLDRLVRSVGDLDKLLQIFDANNIAIRSVTEPFDTTTAMGRFLITLVAAIAQWERETISERVVVTMTKKATMGERNGGKAPFGYRLENEKLVIVEEEARIIREMFRMYLAGHGIRSIVLYLQQFGIEKDIRTIGRWLENPVYTGRLRWGNNSKMDSIITDFAMHEAIVDDETFEKAQQLKQERTTIGKKATSPYHFSGVLRCARCGSAISGYFRKNRGTKHYICINKKNKRTCDLPTFTETALTERFLSELTADDPQQFLSLARGFNLDSNENIDQTRMVKDLEKELAAIKSRKREWLLALGNKIISQEDFLEMTREDSKKEAIIKEQLSEFNQVAVTHDQDTVLALLKNIPQLWDTANDLEKKNFINYVFSKITVDVPSNYYRAPGKTPSVIIKEVDFA